MIMENSQDNMTKIKSLNFRIKLNKNKIWSRC